MQRQHRLWHCRLWLAIVFVLPLAFLFILLLRPDPQREIPPLRLAPAEAGR
jgi:hypothetical protein